MSSRVLKVTAKQVREAADRCPISAPTLEYLFPSAFEVKFKPKNNLVLEGPNKQLYLMKFYNGGIREDAYYLYSLSDYPRIRWDDLTSGQKRAYRVFEGTIFINSQGNIRWIRGGD